MNAGRARHGFTIVELIVVVAIIGVVIALLLPAVQQAREAARRTQCKNNLHQLAVAIHDYTDANKFLLPAGVQVGSRAGGGTTTWSWLVQVLPYLDQASLYDELTTAADTSGAAQKGLLGRPANVLGCPSDPQSGKIHNEASGYFAGAWTLTSYLGVSGTGVVQVSSGKEMLSIEDCTWVETQAGIGSQTGLFFGNSYRTLAEADISDGTSNTLMVGERGLPADGAYGLWTGPGNAGTCPLGWLDVVLSSTGGMHRPTKSSGDVMRWWSHHAAGVQFAFANGSIRFLSYEIDPATFRQLSTRGGGEKTGEF